MKKPLIGITLDSEKKKTYSKFPWYALRVNYLSSVSKFKEECAKSNINYLLLTTYKFKDTTKEINNLDIPDGEYREIDLTRPPFSLPKPLEEILDKDELNKNSGFNCYLNLYTKSQINDLKIK